MMRKLTVEDFWASVDRSAGPDGCWPWTKSLTTDGYGHCFFMGEQLAHRIAYKLMVGEIPKGQCVLHKCDNRPCCNPKDLFTGTRLLNNLDRDQKGRAARGDKHGSRTRPECRPRGEKHACAKLTDYQVDEIRKLYATGGYTHRALGELFGVSHTVVGTVLRFETRKGTCT